MDALDADDETWPTKEFLGDNSIFASTYRGGLEAVSANFLTA